MGEIEGASVAAAAAHEPRLDFPARIGVVRLVYGRMTPVPAAEQTLFAEALDGAASLGEFVTLGPLEAQMNRIPAMRARPLEFRRLGASWRAPHCTVSRIRLMQGQSFSKRLDRNFSKISSPLVAGGAACRQVMAGMAGRWNDGSQLTLCGPAG